MFKFVKLKSCLIIFASSIFLAFGLFNVHSLSGVTEGGVLGATLLLNNWLGITPAITTGILNVICYLIGWKVLGKEFIFYSAFATICYSASYATFEAIGPVFPAIASYPLLASIVGAIFVGVGTGFCVREGGALSGDDALAMSISHVTRLKIQWVYLISDMTILLLSLTYIPLTKILYSVLTVVLSGQIIGFIERFKFAKKSPNQQQTNEKDLEI